MIIPYAYPDGRAFAYPFHVTRTGGSVAEEADYNAYIASLIRQVVLTSPGERINRPDFGAGLRNAIFSALAGGSAGLVKTLVLENIQRWLSDLIEVEAIDVRVEDITLHIVIRYVVMKRGERRYLNLEVVA